MKNLTKYAVFTLSFFLICFYILKFSSHTNLIYIMCTFLCFLLIMYKITTIKYVNTFELAQISLFSSLATIGRCFIIAIPKVNPFLPIIILSSANMNKNCGFLVGVLSIFISNIFLGHGLWTPWQMLAAGIVGYLSSFTFNNKKIKPTFKNLALFSFISIIFIYSFIMDISSVLYSINILNFYAICIYITTSFISNSISAAFCIIFIAVLYNPIMNTIRNMHKILKR